MNFKALLIVASLGLSAGLVSCATETATPPAATTPAAKPAATTKPDAMTKPDATKSETAKPDAAATKKPQ